MALKKKVTKKVAPKSSTSTVPKRTEEEITSKMFKKGNDYFRVRTADRGKVTVTESDLETKRYILVTEANGDKFVVDG